MFTLPRLERASCLGLLFPYPSLSFSWCFFNPWLSSQIPTSSHVWSPVGRTLISAILDGVDEGVFWLLGVRRRGSEPERHSDFSLLLLLLLLLSRFSRVQLCVTPYTAAHQAPLSLGFSRQEHWSGLPFPSPMHESEK